MELTSITLDWDREVISPMTQRGTLFLVVGPSGSGKDSLIEAARTHFCDDPTVVFPRRAITRPANAGGEDHEALDVDMFDHRRDGGAFALHWEAHGLKYGIPRSIEHDLASGRSVVVNVSRSVIDEARDRFRPVCVLKVSVPDAILSKRLADRGREDAQDIAQRLRRAGAYQLDGEDVVDIDNAGSLGATVPAFIRVISEG